MSLEMKPSKTKVIVQERLVQGWHLPVLAAVATNKESLDLQWENIKSIAKAKGVFAVALAYPNSKNDQHKKIMNIFGDAKFAKTMKTLFDNQVVIF
jgi:RNase H-fold protein (predicted Holliday junction resolvase)